MEKILYTVAIDKNGKLIKAIDAEKHEHFLCPICKTELVLRKSGKVGKGTKRPHFAHRILTPNCTAESVLHYSFKHLLYEKITQHITEHVAIPISWHCKYCSEVHSGNLLKKVKEVRVEYDMNICRSDIALLGNEDKVIAVIEIVVTHKPEEKVLKYYIENNIVLIQINLVSDKDLEQLENKINCPDKVEICFNPKCPDCQHHQEKTIMTIIDLPCWNCKSNMKIAVVESGTGRGQNLDAMKYTPKEIEIALSKGVLIKMKYSKSSYQKYYANTCKQCGCFVGDYYLRSIFETALNGEYHYERLDAGYYCGYCIEGPGSEINI